jgi:hypothetical protein
VTTLKLSSNGFHPAIVVFFQEFVEVLDWHADIAKFSNDIAVGTDFDALFYQMFRQSPLRGLFDYYDKLNSMPPANITEKYLKSWFDSDQTALRLYMQMEKEHTRLLEAHRNFRGRY